MDNCREKPVYTGTDGENALWPQVTYEDISEQERRRLRNKSLCNVDEGDFEAWLVIEWEDRKPDPKFLEENAWWAEFWLQRKREEYQYIKGLEVRRQEALSPLIKELAAMSEQAPQYDWHSLYKLERQKLMCMETYLDHSPYPREEAKRWLGLCIRLLGYIVDETSIAPKQLRLLNTKNCLYLLDRFSRGQFLWLEEHGEPIDDDDYTPRSHYLRDLYQRKAERLYYRIRLAHTRKWSE